VGPRAAVTMMTAAPGPVSWLRRAAMRAGVSGGGLVAAAVVVYPQGLL